MCAINLGVPYFDDVMSYNLLTAIVNTNVSLGIKVTNKWKNNFLFQMYFFDTSL